MLLADVLRWLAATPPPREAPDDPAYAAQRARLGELAEPALEDLLEEQGLSGRSKSAPPARSEAGGQIEQLAGACRDATYALAVAKAVHELGIRLAGPQPEWIFSRIAPYVSGPELAAIGRKLAAESDPGRAAFGLRILGRTRAADAGPILLDFLRRGVGGLQAKGL